MRLGAARTTSDVFKGPVLMQGFVLGVKSKTGTPCGADFVETNGSGFTN
jgi:hypothetical protein